MIVTNSSSSDSRSTGFLERIAANQSAQRRSVNEMMASVLSAYLPTAYDEQLNAQLDWLLDSMLLELGCQPGVASAAKQVRGGRALVVTGEAGAGKTRAVRHAFDSRPEFRTEGRWRPLLSVVAPSPFTLGALGNEIARKLGYDGGREIQHSKVWPVVRGLMAECGVRILHIDEAQHGDEIVNSHMSQEVENTLKRMMQEEDWPIWLILSGLPELSRFCQEDSSMRRRVRVVRFEALRFPEHVNAVRQVIKELTALCPSVSCDGVQSDEFVHRLLHAATNQFGILVEYVQDAIVECLSAGDSELAIGHFADVYTIRTGETDDGMNVFIAKDWLAVQVETALFDDKTDYLGEDTRAKRTKGRTGKGGRR